MKTRKGFTLIEILISLALFGALFGSVSYFIVASLSARKNATALSKAVFLARQKMNEIKSFKQEKSDEGDFPAFKGYSYSYEIKEVEIDINKGAEETAEKLGLESELDQFFSDKKASGSGTVTGGIFKVLYYKLTVHYPSKRTYILEFFRSNLGF